MLGDKRFIQTIRLENFLSFGPSSEEIELKSLNVLIGPNASGKSNLIEAVGFLRSSPRDLTLPIREGGGVLEWLWKGTHQHSTAELDATIYCPYPYASMPLRHKIAFTTTGQRFELIDEAVENERPDSPSYGDVRFYYRYNGGNPVLSVFVEGLSDKDEVDGQAQRTTRKLRREDLAKDQSVLSQRKDPDQYPEITYLAEQYGGVHLYREWNLGRYTPPRLPQKTDLPEDFLLEDASNLGLVLNDLEHRGARSTLIERLKQFCDSFRDFSTRIHGGTVQLFLHEEGLHQPVPATRLSDGTLRFLCLLSILCHPLPPSLICIEEPELGLHPDILPTIAELLVDASHRTQLIVTTHSDILVDALTPTPEAILVCEKENGSTTLRRLDATALGKWLKKYSLGELWLKGELGGTRW
jgi:predicted ATPase